MRTMRETLYEKLISYRDSDYYGFHMPGHKRNLELAGVELPYGIDVTEIEGFDDLHHARGILQEAQERAAKVYGAEETHYLVNGSTCGILSAVMGCTRKGDRILMARNCHKSAYHAAFLNELRVEYVYPRYLSEYDLNGEIKAEDLERILREDALRENGMPEAVCVSRRERAEKGRGMEEGDGARCREGGGRICAVVIVSPTYDGVVSDIRAIAEVVHAYGIPLIVDEAHGAHFGFHEYFPENANVQGADVVIHSLHKTLPSLTQTALLHMNGNIVEREEVRRYLHIFQSSSPSYVLMAGMDECIHLLETKAVEMFETYVGMLRRARAELGKMRHLRLVEASGHVMERADARFDFSKIVVSTRGTGKSGKWLYQRLLEDYHLQMEMAAGNYVIAMTSVGDTREGMERFIKAMLEIDGELWQNRNAKGLTFELPRPEQVYTSAEAARMARQERREKNRVHERKNGARPKDCRAMDVRVPDAGLLWEACEGRVSAEYAYIYPPGTPLLVPGERISREVIDILERYRALCFDIEGLGEEGKIKVL